MTRIQTASGEVFLLDPRHEPFVHGDSAYLNDNQLTWSQRIILAVIILLTLIALGSQLVAPERVDETGIITEAEVTEKVLDDTTFDYILTLTFTTEADEMYTVEERVAFDTFDSVEEGDTIEIRYLPVDPTNIQIVNASDVGSQLSVALLIIGLLTIAVLFIAYFWIYRPDRDNRHLVRDGQLLDGRIVNCWPSNIGRRYRVYVAYVFTNPVGDSIEKTESQSRPDLKNSVLPKPGANIKVLYVNPQLFRLM